MLILPCMPKNQPKGTVVLYFFRSWKESLSVLIPKNAHLFFLVTLKTIIKSYKFIIIHLWWIFALSWFTDMIGARYFPASSFFGIIPLILWLATFLGIYLSIRPSLAHKSFTYYIKHAHYLLPFMLITLLIYGATALFLEFFNMISLYSLTPLHTVALATIALLPSAIIPLFVSPVLTFTLLFLLDRPASLMSFNPHPRTSLKAIVRGFKMAYYNYPFCILFYLLCCTVSLLLQTIVLSTFGPFSILFSPLASYALMPIPLCILTNFYTKRLHEQFDLYYPETIKE